MKYVWYFYQIIIKVEFIQQVLIKVPNIKFHENPWNKNKVVYTVSWRDETNSFAKASKKWESRNRQKIQDIETNHLG
jgi:hypothetical protein